VTKTFKEIAKEINEHADSLAALESRITRISEYYLGFNGHLTVPFTYALRDARKQLESLVLHFERVDAS